MFNLPLPPMEGFSWDDLRRIFRGCQTDGQGTIWRRNIPKNFNPLNRAHERYRWQADDIDRQTTDRWTGNGIYSEREREFTFAKNGNP